MPYCVGHIDADWSGGDTAFVQILPRCCGLGVVADCVVHRGACGMSLAVLAIAALHVYLAVSSQITTGGLAK